MPMSNAEIQVLLVEARAAYHALQIGQSVVEARDQNGDLIRYSAANRQQLYLYIQSLEQQLLTPEERAYATGPAGFLF